MKISRPIKKVQTDQQKLPESNGQVQILRYNVKKFINDVTKIYETGTSKIIISENLQIQTTNKDNGIRGYQTREK